MSFFQRKAWGRSSSSMSSAMPMGTPMSAEEAAARYDNADRAHSSNIPNPSQRDGVNSHLQNGTGRDYSQSAGALTGVGVAAFHMVRRYVDMLSVLKAQQAAAFLRSVNRTHRFVDDAYTKLMALLGLVFIPAAGVANWVYTSKFLFIQVSSWLTGLGCLLVVLISIDLVDLIMGSTQFSDFIVGWFNKITEWIFETIIDITTKTILLIIDLGSNATSYSEKAIFFLGSRWLGKFLLTFLVVCMGFLVWNMFEPMVMGAFSEMMRNLFNDVNS